MTVAGQPGRDQARQDVQVRVELTAKPTKKPVQSAASAVTGRIHVTPRRARSKPATSSPRPSQARVIVGTLRRSVAVNVDTTIARWRTLSGLEPA
jgi:hypothetical protein